MEHHHGNMTSQQTKQKSLKLVLEILYEAAMASVLKSICRKKAKADKFLITASVSLLSIDCRKKNGKGWKKSTFFVFVYV